MDILTIDIPNEISSKFEMFAFKKCASYLRLPKCCVFNTNPGVAGSSPGPVTYSRGDFSLNNFNGHSPPMK